MAIFSERLKLLRRAMKRRGFQTVFLASPISRRYISGFSGTSGAILVGAEGRARFFTDFRYAERAESELASAFDIVSIEAGFTKALKQEIKKRKIRRLGIEDNAMSVARYEALKRSLEGCSLIGMGAMLEEQRAIKDEYELAILRMAVLVTDKTFQELIRWLKHLKQTKRLPSEEAVAWKVRDIVHSKKLGELAFDPIIASGPNAARPHHEPSAKKLKFGEMIIIDLGVKLNGYHADMTRTIFLGEPTTKQRKMYETTLRAQTAAIRYLKFGGRSARETDTVARRVIDAKFPGAFGHALGHGVGLEIHEHPKLAQNSKDILKPNMVFSVEPGIYLPGEGGVRIEDLVVLNKKGCQVLSQSPKSFAEAII